MIRLLLCFALQLSLDFAHASRVGTIVVEQGQGSPKIHMLGDQPDTGATALEAHLNSLVDFTIHQNSTEDAEYLALCLIVKDQHRDIREWIEHHVRLGVDKFYVFDHNSQIPVEAVLFDYIDSGFVDVLQFNASDKERPQIHVYNRCLKEFGHRHQWMGFLDVDEFVFLHDSSRSLATFLKDFESYGGLGINWIMFGPSGHVTRPKGGVVSNYFQCYPLDHEQHKHIKTIANTQYTVRAKGPHTFEFKEGSYCVTEWGDPIEGPFSSHPSHSRIALHHYVTKSRQEYEEKMSRGSAMGNHKTIHFFDAVQKNATHDCSTMVGYTEEVKVTMYLSVEEPNTALLRS